jgi:hypothetical protein
MGIDCEVEREVWCIAYGKTRCSLGERCAAMYIGQKLGTLAKNYSYLLFRRELKNDSHRYVTRRNDVPPTL